MRSDTLGAERPTILRDVCDAGACVLGQRLEDARVDRVDAAVFISKAFHRFRL